MNSIDDLDLSKSYTYADYYSWRFEERLELIKGKIFKMSPAPTGNHQLIAGSIFAELHHFLKGQNCKVFMAPFDVRLVRDETSDKKVKNVVQPDVCVVCDMAKMADPRSCLGAPDIIVEVLSTGNSSKELKTKYDLYEEFGVKEYWVVYPSEQSLVRYVLDTNGKFATEGRALTGGDTLTTPILPGFELAMDDVFRDLL
ncbi:Uma2 family endonuclease [Mucilaginibacter myungsuensis]|uniref:Uma2 family endonuclease n=1 Tax=Mucilaginibacter myungsuensis TaxID=649104 RepID=A0A929PXE4_9SPHI|nr:Uma2 family endonuclease [Mucilaginibacter myungsuensis]MBE9662315.1 Uma2 family endonuclease [Mucilaginibacter myungsuensis]MDN3599248.1 Uma2 family endonuclease [Mucilaginibacter myungsuensis]